MVIYITDAIELQAINDDLTGDYELANDINCSGVDFVPIGRTASTEFTGTLDGKGYTISNLSIELDMNEDYAGLFYKADNATLQNIRHPRTSLCWYTCRVSN